MEIKHAIHLSALETIRLHSSELAQYLATKTHQLRMCKVNVLTEKAKDIENELRHLGIEMKETE